MRLQNIRCYLAIIVLIFLPARLAMAGLLADITSNSKSNEWFDLKTDNSGPSYSSDALFNSDISLPKIKKVSGKAKFINYTTKNPKDVVLGYIVNVTVENLDTSKIPKKYLEDKKEKYKGGEWTMLGISEVVYDVVLHFVLKDKDGFTLMVLTSGEEQGLSLYSGKTNQFQETIPTNLIPENIVKHTESISLEIHVEKCVTCGKR